MELSIYRISHVYLPKSVLALKSFVILINIKTYMPSPSLGPAMAFYVRSVVNI